MVTFKKCHSVFNTGIPLPNSTIHGFTLEGNLFLHTYFLELKRRASFFFPSIDNTVAAICLGVNPASSN